MEKPFKQRPTSYLSLETRFILLLLASVEAERRFIQLLEFHQGVK
jgi:hypothetical protein